MRRTLAIIAAFSVFALAETAFAANDGGLLIPDRHFNDDVKVWLARAMVSEAGWDETADHVAIAYVLLRRWELAKKSYKRASMIDIVKKYCAGFRGAPLTPRQKWVKNMTIDGKRPEGWPNDIFWKHYRARWMAVLDLVDSWRRGEHPDPCGGRAMYWGGPTDRPSKRMIRMDCGQTKNRFYTVKPLL